VFARAELWGALFWLCMGLFVAWSGRDLGLGTLQEPGSGFVLFWLGVLMVGLALPLATSAILVGSPSLASLWAGTRWQRVLVVIALLLVFGFAFERVGFIPGAVALLLVLMLFVDFVGWGKAIVISIAAPTIVWFVMTTWLKVQLPAGILSGWLG
jgi:putative tricarboxylic transport membrane protein